MLRRGSYIFLARTSGTLQRMPAGVAASELAAGAWKVHLHVCVQVHADLCSVSLSNSVTPQRAV